MKTTFFLKDIEAAHSILAKLNEVEVADLVLTDEQGQQIEIPANLAAAWNFVGLNTSTFVKMRAWEEPNKSEITSMGAP